MADYDLTGKLKVDFTFTIADCEYKFVKPTVRQMREIAKQFSSIEKEEDSEKQIELSEKAMAALYGYVEITKGNTPIEDAIADQPIGVQNAFNDMIKEQLGSA